MIIGNKKTFAFEIGEKTSDDYSQVRKVNIYIADHNVSCRDNTVYVSSFVGAVWHTARDLRHKLDYYSDEDIFFGHSIEQAHKIITKLILSLYKENSAEEDEFLLSRVRKYWYDFLDWGETTDGVFSFLFPINGKLYLTLEYKDKNHQPAMEIGEGFATEITPYEIIQVCEMAIAVLNDKNLYLTEKSP